MHFEDAKWPQSWQMRCFCGRAAPSVTASSSNSDAKTFTIASLFLFEAVSDAALRPPRGGANISAQIVRLAEVLITQRKATSRTLGINVLSSNSAGNRCNYKYCSRR